MAGLLSQDEIDVLMGAISDERVPAAAHSTAPLAPPKVIRPYDFAHPNTFTREQLKLLQVCHDSFSHHLSDTLDSYLRTSIQGKCVGVDQLPVSEWLSALPTSSTGLVLACAGTDHPLLMAIPPSVGSGVLDRLLGGPGVPDNMARTFTGIESALLEHFYSRLVSALCATWSTYGKATLKLSSVESNTEQLKLNLPGQALAVVNVELRFAQTQGLISLGYPASFLSLFRDFSAVKPTRIDSSAAGASARRKTEQVISGVPLMLTANLGSASLQLSELMQIKPNDVIPLFRGLHDPVDVEVGGQVRFRGHLGVRHGKKAILIQQRVELAERT